MEKSLEFLLFHKICTYSNFQKYVIIHEIWPKTPNLECCCEHDEYNIVNLCNRVIIASVERIMLTKAINLK